MKNTVHTLMSLVTLIGLLGMSQGASADVSGDAVAGAKKAQMCIGCHGIEGYKASFPQIYQVPMISGQNAKYIASALAQYKKGERKHPTMRAIASSLGEQDMADLAAFYSTEAKADAVPAALPGDAPTQVAELLKKGNCQSCHGQNLSTPIDPSYPKLAGQHPDYLFAALKAYQTDNNPRIGRGNPVMMGMAKPFSHAELQALADYFGTLPTELKVVPQSRFR